MAPDIQDSVSAESIGQLPDTTITDALQRITGVQIDRNAGEGAQVDVRGLPEVGSMLNGEVFISPDQITSQQPDFETLPATLFNQVDVIKSPTASQTETGITGALDLHTFRPWDLPHGFTFSYNADGERGSVARKNGPEASGLVAFNGDGRWGLLVAADFSDTTRNGPESDGANAGSSEGLDQYGVVLNNESAPLNSAGGNYGGYTGFLAPWNGLAIPSKIVQNPDGSVDVNGDGKSNGVFMGSQDIGLYESSIERKREAGNASFQADLGGGFKLTSDYFYTQQRQWNRNVGLQFNSTDWQGATYVPLQSKNTGATSLGQYNTPPPGGGVNPGWRRLADLYHPGVRKVAGRCRIVLAGPEHGLRGAERQSAGGFRQWRQFPRQPAGHPRDARPRHTSKPTSTSPIPTAASGPMSCCPMSPPARRRPAAPSSILRNWAGTAYSTRSASPRTRSRSSRISPAATSG